MNNTGLILVLAYPETVVMVADEWYSPLLKYVGIGKKDYVRAGHAALVLIEKETGELHYHDFGRYITPEPMGRVRGKDTDGELNFSIRARMEGDQIANLKDILSFLAIHPRFTHGDGKLYASVCDEIDFKKAKTHIAQMQQKEFIRYAAFIKNACNCARFVTDALIASTTNKSIKRKLIKSKKFTPSTIGNVVLSANKLGVFEVAENGEVRSFSSTLKKVNRRCFLDRLNGFQPNYIGNLLPKEVGNKTDKAQWLSGIAAGAWFDVLEENGNQVTFRRISPYGHIDVHARFETREQDIDWKESFEFVPYSNCKYFHLKQGNKIFRFDRVD